MGSDDNSPIGHDGIGAPRTPQPFDARALQQLLANMAAEAPRAASDRAEIFIRNDAEFRPAAKRRRNGASLWMMGGLFVVTMTYLVFNEQMVGGQPRRPEIGAPPPLAAHPTDPSVMPTSGEARLMILRPAISPPRPPAVVHISPPPATVSQGSSSEALRDAALGTEDSAKPPATPPVFVLGQQNAPPKVNPSFDCGSARDLAQDLVCENPQLAHQDREMADAYRRALDSGAPPSLLQLQQERWLAARDEAAHLEPSALGRVYSIRIDELNAIAEEGSETLSP